MQILFCDTLLSVRLVYYLKLALNIIRFVVPILLIIKISLDVYKNMINGIDRQELVKKENNRIIATIIVFLIPTFVGIFLSFLGAINNNTSYKVTFATCYNNVNKDLLTQIEKIENDKLNSEDEKLRKQNEIYMANYKAMMKQNDEIVKKNKQNSQTDSKTPSSSGTNYNSNLTDMNKQNQVYVKNGVFYKPKYKSGDSNTYSGKNCPSNPSSQGYNNKYGYNNYFYTMLQNLIAGAKKAGYNLDISTQGCRSYATQESYYKSMEKGRAARPGKSNHGWGIASDVTFYKNSSNRCSGSRTRENCPGMAWVHDHAADYGLHFPLLHASYKEDWHIEPINLKTY